MTSVFIYVVPGETLPCIENVILCGADRLSWLSEISVDLRGVAGVEQHVAVQATVFIFHDPQFFVADFLREWQTNDIDGKRIESILRDTGIWQATASWSIRFQVCHITQRNDVFELVICAGNVTFVLRVFVLENAASNICLGETIPNFHVCAVQQ
ncbi:hypothetical protein D3C71_1214740 [compost metagenome]